MATKTAPRSASPPGPRPGSKAVRHSPAQQRATLAFMKSLPAKLRCSHCGKLKPKTDIDYRLMKRSDGSKYPARQSRCRDCR